MQSECLENTANTSAAFASSPEKWLIALMESNYSKSDQEKLDIIREKCKKLLIANVQYHEGMAKLKIDSEPVIARQHRLLAHIYRSLNESCNSVTERQ